MTTCEELDGLLAERASGEIAAEERALLDAHLPGCERCRKELAAYESTFALVREAIPRDDRGARFAAAPSPQHPGALRGRPRAPSVLREEIRRGGPAAPSSLRWRGSRDDRSLAPGRRESPAGHADLASAALAAWKRRHQRRVTTVTLGAGFLAAAVAALVALSPALLHRSLRSHPAVSAELASAPRWEPDVDGALSAAGLLETDTEAGQVGSEEALAAEEVALAAYDAAAVPAASDEP